MFGRFWKYSDTRINLQPINEEEPRLGGRVQATQTSFDVRTFTLQNKTYHGVYGEDFLTFGQFAEEADPENEATLLKIFEEGSEEVVDRHMFKFADQQVTYGRSVNAEYVDADVEHEIETTQLHNNVGDSWSEALFYGVGNSKM